MRSRNNAGWAVAALVATAACHPSPTTVRLKPDTTVTGRPDATTARSVDALRRDIDAALAQPSLARGYWGVLVKSLKTDETLYALNAGKLMLPASNMKIVTLAAAAEKLGWDFTYETTVLAAGPISNGVLDGDLVVVGSGDPSLVAADGMADRVFGDWAQQLKQRGVRTVSGRVVGDDNGFEKETLGFGWMWDDLPDDYSAGVGALQYNESAVRVTIAPGPAAGDAAGISIVPGGSGLTIVSAVGTAAAGGSASMSTRRLPGSMKLELRGSIPVDAAPSALNVSVDNPTQFFVSALRTALIANGIDVRGPAVDVDEVGDAPAASRATALISYRSPPLSTLAMRLMKISQNQYAETLLKTVGAAPGVIPAAAAGRGAAQAIFERWGVKADALIQRDGSGLSRYDLVTPEALVTILTHVDRDPRLKEPFERSLPIAGGEGLSSRMKGTPAEGNVRAKTGSMTGVRGLSGYVTAADGEPLVFSILANNFEIPAASVNQTTDAIVIRLASFRR